VQPLGPGHQDEVSSIVVSIWLRMPRMKPAAEANTTVKAGSKA